MTLFCEFQDFLPESAPESVELSESLTALVATNPKSMDDIAAELPEEPKITPAAEGVTKLTKVEQQ